MRRADLLAAAGMEQVRLLCCIDCLEERKEQTTPFGVNLLRSQVLYWATQETA